MKIEKVKKECRLSGFYKVLTWDNVWIVGEWIQTAKTWFLTGDLQLYTDDSFAEINERIIPLERIRDKGGLLYVFFEMEDSGGG